MALLFERGARGRAAWAAASTTTAGVSTEREARKDGEFVEVKQSSVPPTTGAPTARARSDPSAFDRSPLQLARRQDIPGDRGEEVGREKGDEKEEDKHRRATRRRVRNGALSEPDSGQKDGRNRGKRAINTSVYFDDQEETIDSQCLPRPVARPRLRSLRPVQVPSPFGEDRIGVDKDTAVVALRK